MSKLQTLEERGFYFLERLLPKKEREKEGEKREKKSDPVEFPSWLDEQTDVLSLNCVKIP